MTDLSKSPDRIAGMFDAIAGQLRLPQSSAERRHRSTLAAARDSVAGADGSRTRARSVHGHRRIWRSRRVTRVPARRESSASTSPARCSRSGSEKIRRPQARPTGDARSRRRDADSVADGSVDAVTVAFGIRNVEHTAGACAEIHRVLRRAAGSRSSSSRFPTTPSSAGLSLVLQPGPARHRPARVEAQRGLRLPAGLGRRLCHAGRVRENSATTGIRRHSGQPAHLRHRLSLYGTTRLEAEAGAELELSLLVLAPASNLQPPTVILT